MRGSRFFCSPFKQRFPERTALVRQADDPGLAAAGQLGQVQGPHVALDHLLLALSAAFNAKGNWRLTGTTLYVTKEPCPMCAGAIVLARPDRVVWGVSDPKRGGSTVFDILRHPGMNHHPEIVSGILEDRCKAVLVDFFKKRRAD